MTALLSLSRDPLAEAINVELLVLGYTVMGPEEIRGLDAADRITTLEADLEDISEIIWGEPADNARLQPTETYGVLTVSWAVGYDGKPDTAVARILEARTRTVIAGFTWENARNGMRQSIADRQTRKSVAEAGEEIAEALAIELRDQARVPH